ncbi:MAG: hypothetical protein ABR941_11510 [Thermoleophilia bacterium]
MWEMVTVATAGTVGGDTILIATEDGYALVCRALAVHRSTHHARHLWLGGSGLGRRLRIDYARATNRSIVEDLASGTYGYTVYATPVGSNVASVFFLPTSDLVAKNIIASGTFTIP